MTRAVIFATALLVLFSAAAEAACRRVSYAGGAEYGYLIGNPTKFVKQGVLDYERAFKWAINDKCANKAHGGVVYYCKTEAGWFVAHRRGTNVFTTDASDAACKPAMAF